jgi:hypothetical protein
MLLREIEDALGPLGKVYCCREWTVAIFARYGRCGYCGEHPTPLPPEDADVQPE